MLRGNSSSTITSWPPTESLSASMAVISTVLFSEREQNSIKDFSTNNCSKILSLCVSYFTPVYVMKLKDFFPNKELREAPYFDGRVVCYPNMKTIHDYLAWRQLDRHNRIQYKTCFLDASEVRKGRKRSLRYAEVFFHHLRQRTRTSC
ncbi:hypothetical protein VPH35_013594 [Triticum aestivum]